MSNIKSINVNGSIYEIGSSSSSELPIIDYSNGDFGIADEQGNILVNFKDGHIKTKNFNSNNIQTNISTNIHLKIYVIGNSYSLDSFMYVPFILKNYGITIEIGIYYRGGGSIQDAVNEFNGNGNTTYYIDTRTQTKWTSIGTKNIPSGLVYKEWDIVVIQQGSIASVSENSYEPYTRKLLNMIMNILNRPVKFAWNININRNSSGTGQAIENNILNNIKNTISKEPISLVFPYGTAIFNARTNTILDNIGDGEHLWASDKVHLQEGLPCYIAALANTQALFDMYYPQFSVMGDITKPTQDMLAAWGVGGQNGSSIGITEDNCRLAQICAVLANNKKFEISEITVN